MDRLKNQKIIVSHDHNDLIILYYGPHDFREKNGKWVFDCDKFISILPYDMPGNDLVDVRTEPHSKTGKITNTIKNPDNWMSYKEWVETDGAKEVIRRLFK